MLKISICGTGHFGFALLKHLNRKNNLDYSLYAYDKDRKLIKYLKNKRKHPFHHNNISIGKEITFTTNIKELLDKTDILIMAVTSDAIESALKTIKPHINSKLIILNTSKALENKTGKRMSEIINKSLKNTKHPFTIAMLAGGTIANDLLQDEPLGIDIACKNKKVLQVLRNTFVSDNLNVYTTKDLAGMEYASAFKNVISILAGIVSGLGFSYGSETHLISRAADEVEKLVTTKLSGQKKTFSIGSQCWGNDMWMSCTGKTRNREFGTLLGKKYTAKDALNKMEKEHKSVEGVNTLKVLKKIIKNDSQNFPLLHSLNEIVYKNKNSRDILLSLLRNNKI